MFTTTPQTNIGRKWTPVMSALYPWNLWNQIESQKVTIGNPMKPKHMMASN